MIASEPTEQTTYTITFTHDGKQCTQSVLGYGPYHAEAQFINLCRAAGVEVEVVDVKEEK